MKSSWIHTFAKNISNMWNANRIWTRVAESNTCYASSASTNIITAHLKAKRIKWQFKKQNSSPNSNKYYSSQYKNIVVPK